MRRPPFVESRLLRRVASAAGGLRDVRADAKGVVRHDPIAVIPLSAMISSKSCGLSIGLRTFDRLDDQGNIYAADVGLNNLRKYVKVR